MNNPFFSVIVPVHNAAEYMGKGFKSIRQQTFIDFELITICDSCTDRSADIALGYSNKVINTNYSRDGLARNAGLEVANGEWILFMDDDDWWLHKYVFEMIADKIGKQGEDILTFGFLAKDFNNKGLQHYYNSQWHVWPAVWNKCYRREFIGDTRFPGIEYASDLPFTKELYNKKPRVLDWMIPMYYYNYMRKGSQTEIHSREGNK